MILAKGTGISATNQTGYTGANARYYLYKSSGTQQDISIDATVSTGYTWSTWTKTGANLTTFTAGTKSQNVRIGQGATTLTANATANTYTISYDYAGGTGGTNKPTSGTYDTDVQISNPTKAGYTFAGWTSSSSDGLGENAKTGTAANPSTAWTGTATENTYFKNLTDTNNGTVKLTATWIANTYTIEFNNNTSYTTTGTMASISTTYGNTVTLAANSFVITQANVPSNQLFAEWNTQADGSGTRIEDEASVSNLTTEPNGVVTLYAQWMDASYEVSSPVKYTLEIDDAIEVADADSTIKVLKETSDSTPAVINKNLTLNLNGYTLRRSREINVQSGNFTLLGASSFTDDEVSGSLICRYVSGEASSGRGIYNGGSSSSINIKNGALLECDLTAIEFNESGHNYTGNLILEDAFINVTGAATAINIGSANSVIINNSWIYMRYGCEHVIKVVNELPWMTIKRRSRIGGGSNDHPANNYLSVIYFSSGAASGATLNLYIEGDDKTKVSPIIMGGEYNYSAITADRKTTFEIKDESELYARRVTSDRNTVCIDCRNSGCVVHIATSGWIYSGGNNVINIPNQNNLTINQGSFACYTKNVDNKAKYVSKNSERDDHGFYYMTGYHNYICSSQYSLYFYGKGWIKFGNTFDYLWTYWENGTQQFGWKQLGNDWYYLYKSSENPQLEAGDNRVFENGQMVTGWVKLSGYWYYLTKKTDNITLNGQEYGIIEGRMLAGGTYVVNDITMTFNSSGQLQP